MTQFTGIHTFQAQDVMLPRSSKLRSMDVTSTHTERVTGTRGSVRFNGKVIAVVYDEALGFWFVK